MRSFYRWLMSQATWEMQAIALERRVFILKWDT